MKTRLLIMAILCIMATNIYAQKAKDTLCTILPPVSPQIKKGSFLIGGSILYNKKDQDLGFRQEKTFDLSPRIGYFIADNLAIGLGLNYKFAYKNGLGSYASNGHKDTGFGISAFGRYYVNISNEFKFFGQLKLNATNGKLRYTDNNGNSYQDLYKYNQYTAALAPGFAFLPGKRWSVDLSLVLAQYRRKIINDAQIDVFNSSDFQLGLSTISPEIGINFHF